MDGFVPARRACLGAAIAAGFAAAAAAVHAQERWQLATGYRSESFHTENLRQFAADVARESAGRLDIQVHPDNTLVRLADIRAQVEAGKIAAGEVIMTSMARDVPIAGADGVPFLVRSHADARRLWQHQRPLVEAALAQRGLVVQYAVPWPSQGLYTTKAVRSSGDLAGAKMRTYNPTTVRIAELLGATPVDVPMTEVGQALAAGRMNCMITSGITGVENKVWDKLKYFYDIRAWYPKNIVVVHRGRYDALDAGTREALQRAARAAEQRGWALSEAAAEESLKTLASHGVRVEPASFEFGSELRRIGERFSVEWVRATGSDASTMLIPYYTTASR